MKNTAKMQAMEKLTDKTAVKTQYTTIEVAHLLGMAVRSVQLMVDRGELDAWKTPGGHRRISSDSVTRWLASRQVGAPTSTTEKPLGSVRASMAGSPARRADAAKEMTQVLLIEDSIHYQNLVGLLIKQRFPQVQLSVADDGITGLALYGKLEPDVLIVDILLPGIDGAALITTLRSHPSFSSSRLIVITSLDEAQRAPYAFALQDVPVIHKTQLVNELPALLEAALQSAATREPAL